MLSSHCHTYAAPVHASTSAASFDGPEDASWRAATFKDPVCATDSAVAASTGEGGTSTAGQGAGPGATALSGANEGPGAGSSGGGGVGPQTTGVCATPGGVGASPTIHTAAALRAIQEQSAQ